MAKTAKKNRRRNARRAKRELNAALRGEGSAPKSRNQMVLGMLLHCKGGRMTDRKKQASKKACRGRYRGE